MRNIPGASEKIAGNACFIQEPQTLKGQWLEYFPNVRQLHVEIGSGKGQFITALAQQQTDIAFVAIERYSSVLMKLIKKIPETGMPNLAVMNVNARLMEEYFAPGEIDCVYLNFSDPWPKSRHEDRRLTSKVFLDIYRKVLAQGGEIHLKTDNVSLFDFSIQSFTENGWTLVDITRDLHNSVWAENNMMTEYEERFSSLGQKIHRFVAHYVS